MPERLRAEFQYVKDMNLIRFAWKDNFSRITFLISPMSMDSDHGRLVLLLALEHWQHRDDYKEGPLDQRDYDIAAKSQQIRSGA